MREVMTEPMRVAVGRHELTFVPHGRFGHLARDKVLVGALALVAALALSVALPTPAWADGVADVVDGLGELLFKPLAQALADAINSFMQFVGIGYAGGAVSEMFNNFVANAGIELSDPGGLALNLTQPFDALLGTGAASGSLYTLMENVSNVAVRPIAASLFSLVMLVQLLKIARRMDEHSALPGVREVLMLLVFCAIFMVLIRDATGVMTALYTLVNEMSKAVASSEVTNVIKLTVPDGESAATYLTMIVLLVLLLLVCAACAICAYLMSIARAFELYLLAAFAPIPMTFLALDETRQWGLGYIKEFATAALQGTVLIFIFAALPAVFSSVLSMGDVPAAEAVSTASGTLNVITLNIAGLFFDPFLFVTTVAAMLFLILAVLRSGTFARKILGG